jgi:hypothetical protein
MSAYKVGYFVGSLAKASINRLLSKALVRLAPPELAMTEISFRDLPLYSYDYDADFPPVARAFKSALAAAEAVLFVTPEYNRSVPGTRSSCACTRCCRGGRDASAVVKPYGSDRSRARRGGSATA